MQVSPREATLLVKDGKLVKASLREAERVGAQACEPLRRDQDDGASRRIAPQLSATRLLRR